MINYYLKFKNQKSALAELVNADVIKNISNEKKKIDIVPCDCFEIEYIGVINKVIGSQIDDGVESPIYEKQDGYHVNVRAKEPCEALDKFVIECKTPHRVWLS